MAAWFSAATPRAVDRPRILAPFCHVPEFIPRTPGLLSDRTVGAGPLTASSPGGIMSEFGERPEMDVRAAVELRTRLPQASAQTEAFDLLYYEFGALSLTGW